MHCCSGQFCCSVQFCCSEQFCSNGKPENLDMSHQFPKTNIETCQCMQEDSDSDWNFVDYNYPASGINYCGTVPPLISGIIEPICDETLKNVLRNDPVFTTEPETAQLEEKFVFQGQQLNTTQDLQLLSNTERSEEELFFDGMRNNYNLNTRYVPDKGNVGSDPTFVNLNPPIVCAKLYFDMDNKTIESFTNVVTPRQNSFTPVPEILNDNEMHNHGVNDQTDFYSELDLSFYPTNDEITIDQWNNLQRTEYLSKVLPARIRKIEQFCYTMKPLVVENMLSEINSLLDRYDKPDNYASQKIMQS